MNLHGITDRTIKVRRKFVAWVAYKHNIFVVESQVQQICATYLIYFAK
jgi:hypothetical protein